MKKIGLIVVLLGICISLKSYSSGNSEKFQYIYYSQKSINKDFSTTFSHISYGEENTLTKLHSGSKNICKLLGYEDVIEENIIYSVDLVDSYKLQTNAKKTQRKKFVLSDKKKHQYINTITCFRESELAPAVSWKNKKMNLDRSVTFQGPKFHLGHSKYEIIGGTAGTCYLLGYDSFMQGSLVRSKLETEGVLVGNKGTYKKLYESESISELTCYNKKGYRHTVIYKDSKLNSDNSTTYTDLEYIHGKKNYLVTKGKLGTCKLLGHDDPLKGGEIWSEKELIGMEISSSGEIVGTHKKRYLKELTCYNNKTYKFSFVSNTVVANKDGSVTFDFPEFSRGPYFHYIGKGSTDICRWLGFRQHVSKKDVWSRKKGHALLFKKNGAIDEVKNSFYLLKTTCKNVL